MLDTRAGIHFHNAPKGSFGCAGRGCPIMPGWAPNWAACPIGLGPPIPYKNMFKLSHLVD